MRAIAFALVLLGTAVAAASAPVEVESAPAAQKKKTVVVKDEILVQGSRPKPVQVVIPRNPAVKKALDSSSDHLNDALQRP